MTSFGDGFVRLFGAIVGDDAAADVSGAMLWPDTSLAPLCSLFCTTNAGSQLLARIFTFVLNIIIARSLSLSNYGVSAVQFHLINSSIVFLAREGVRRSCLRSSSDDGSLLSGSLLAIPAGFLLATATATFFYARGNIPAVMQCVAAFIEVLSEPLYVLATARSWFGMRTGCEATAMVAKNVASVWLLTSRSFAWMDPTVAISWGQVVYGCVLLACFAVGTWCMGMGNVPKIGRVERNFYSFYATFTFQAMGKLILAEGSKAVLAVVTSPAVQGVYGLVNNLGSLVVRTLFQPFEELVFVTFSSGCSRSEREGGTTDAGNEARDDHKRKQATLLGSLSKIVCTIGGIMAAFGPSYAYVALRILYGERWASSDAPQALGLYSIYVALLAMNGTLEAFLHGVADQKNLLKNNVALILASLAHMGLSVGMVKAYGAAGLLVADAINMVLRILYACVFVDAYFKDVCGGLRGVGLFPSWSVTSTLILASALARASSATFLGGIDQKATPTLMQMAKHVGVGCVLLLAVLSSIYNSDIPSQVKLLKTGGSPKRKTT